MRIKINDMLDRYIRLPSKYQSKIGYATMIQKVILKELIIILGATITNLYIELKMKISGTKYLESSFFIVYFYMNDYYLYHRIQY